MPRHDFRCVCGAAALDVYRSIDEGGQARPPICDRCGRPMQWIPAARWDLRSDGKDFAKFEVADGRNAPVVIDSLHKLRQVERESEQQARNGEGQQMVWRAYSQNRGNRLDHSIAPPPDQSVPQAAKEKFGLGRGTRALEGEPDRPFGPGVHQGNTSALPDSPG